MLCNNVTVRVCTCGFFAKCFTWHVWECLGYNLLFTTFGSCEMGVLYKTARADLQGWEREVTSGAEGYYASRYVSWPPPLPSHERFRNFPLTGHDKWNPVIPSAYGYGTEGKASHMQAFHDTGRPCRTCASDMPEEESRPMTATILRQQGIHPHPGPSGHGLVSILDDECWDL